MADLDRALAAFATHPVVLIACDYDGTLSPIVDDPSQAVPLRESILALRSLAQLPDTHVAVISGRSLRDLAALSRLPEEVHLVGSHGSEFDVGFAQRIDEEALGVRAGLIDELRAIAAVTPGAFVEQKPSGAAFHYRSVARSDVEAVVARILSGPAAHDDVHVRHGKEVVELSVVETDKGDALERVRHQVHASAALFVGDDVTDEDAFAVLSGPDVGVKVGSGETIATHRLDGPLDVARLLADLYERRRSWLEEGAAVPLESLSLLSDQRTVAMVGPDGSVNWMCHPRPDSPAIFAALLGSPADGCFSVAPVAGTPPLEQRYVGDSMILETIWADLTVTDYLDASDVTRSSGTGCALLVRVLEGSGAVNIDFAPRLDYGRAPTRLAVVGDSVVVRASSDPLRLVAPGVEWVIDHGVDHDRATGRVVLDAGVPCVLELHLGVPEHETADARVDEQQRRLATSARWREWASTLSTRSEPVRRSALILKALCHEPTGAMLAAATTSLPSVIGGIRNWDYRYCWLRDTSVACAALVALGSTTEAVAFLDWLTERAGTVPGVEGLRPLYPLAGNEFLPEAVIPSLRGYRCSSPVRIGNLAEHQLQLDMFGPVVALAAQLGAAGVDLRPEHRELVAAFADAVAQRWEEPDHGIWEARIAPAHYVHSKAMCWVALDRAIAIAVRDHHTPTTAWVEARDAIRADVLDRGWNDESGSYTVAYGSREVDASILQLVVVGLLSPVDPRTIATIETVEARLRDGVSLRRYDYDDGLPGQESGFLLCTSWLIEALAAIGRIDDARELYDRYLDVQGPTGLLTEQYDSQRRLSLGNAAQAYSHAGLIHAAIATGLS